ncbi:helix-hairpin-helix domain-containing protein [Haloferula sp.]|uniref:helix-hairpin-helix domain-containing protein n=1 Tax=Haloferula sp. TaxID=2497595 RepID=UPI003C71E5AC
MKGLSILILLVGGLLQAAQPLTKLPNCVLVPTEWADGDSFLIRTSDGNEHTVRLYGTDCIEARVTDNSDARRLRSQRRYFGISEAGGSPQSSIAIAKDFGEKAAQRTVALLQQPFTVYTAFSDARGDGRYKRIYAFVTTAEKRDLASQLVGEGLARAFGVYRETPNKDHADTYREELRDLELQAAKRGAGVWAKTDWEKLPAERRLERSEEAELALATDAGSSIEPNSIDPNTAARDELMRLPGIGEVTANAIIENRPFKSIDELTRVSGIGPKTLERIRGSLRIGE